MKKATIYKRSRVETEESVFELEVKIQKANVNYDRITSFGKYCLESNLKELDKLKGWLKQTDDEWLYTFNGELVNDKLPEFMKF